MAPRADGTVYINSSIDTDGFTAGGKEIEAAARRAARTVKGIGDAARIALERQTAAFVKSNQLYAQQEQKVKDLEKQLEEMSTQKVGTEVFEELQKVIDTDTEKLNKLKEKQDEFLLTGGKENSAAYKRRQLQIEELQNSIRNAKTEQDEFIASGEAYQPVDTSAIEQKLVTEKERLLQMNNSLNISYDSLKNKVAEFAEQVAKDESKISALNEKMEMLRAIEVQAIMEAERLREIGESAEISDQHVVDLNNELVTLKERQVDLSKAGVGLGFEEFDQNIARIAEIEQELKNYLFSLSDAEKTTVRFSNRLKKAFSGVVSVAKKAGAAILLLHKNTKKSNGSMGTGIKNILKYTLGISSLIALFNKIRSAVKEGMENLAQYSSETNTNLSVLKSSLTQLKNSLATAFNPILTVVTPILTQFIDMLSQAATYVGMFFAAFTGQKSFTKAAAVQEDWAASLKDTADAAKEAKKYLSGLDEVRTYSDGNSSGGYKAPTPEEMFETVEIPSFVDDWVGKFKDAWKNADFSEIGSFVGSKIKNTLGGISWEDIKEGAKNIGGSIATFINGVVETPGLFSEIGVSVGEGINTVVSGAKEFFSTTKFAEVGQSIADSLNSAMETTEWDELAVTISDGIIGALDTAIGFLDEFDWEGTADSIWEFLENIKWGDIFGRLGLLILETVRGVFSFGNQLGQDITASLAEFFREIGWDSVAGFFDGFSEEIKRYGEVIKGGFQIVIDWAKEKLGIHSPSTVFAQIGIYVIQGFINGITSMFTVVNSKFTTLITTIISAFTNFRTSVLTIWSEISSNIKNNVNSIIGFVNKMISGIVSGINTMINAMNALHFDVPDWVPFLGGKSFGFSVSTITAPQIPYLATGAVIPPNAPFMAVLGDQKSGNNIEAPENLIRRIVREESSGQGFNGTIRVPVTLNGRQILEAIVDAAKLQQTVSGNNPFELA